MAHDGGGISNGNVERTSWRRVRHLELVVVSAQIDSFFERNKKDTLAPTYAWTELKRQVFGLQSEGNSITSANTLATLQRMSVKDMQRLDAVRLREFIAQLWRWHELASATLAARANPDGRRLQ
jgi:hypothetical protein